MYELVQKLHKVVNLYLFELRISKLKIVREFLRLLFGAKKFLLVILSLY
jgi:hypothetical protein